MQRTAQLAATALAMALAVGGSLYLYRTLAGRPDFYAPSRSPLTQAQVLLTEAYGQDRSSIEELDDARGALTRALALVEKAERLDPVDRRQLATMRRRLGMLEDQRRIGSMTATELDAAYRRVKHELNALIRKHQRPVSAGPGAVPRSPFRPPAATAAAADR